MQHHHQRHHMSGWTHSLITWARPVRHSSLCVVTLTYCLVQLSRPSPLRTCKSFWLRNAFPVTLPASCANARTKNIVAKRHTWSEAQQSSAELLSKVKKRGAEAVNLKCRLLLKNCFHDTSHSFQTQFCFKIPFSRGPPLPLLIIWG